jgi:hypothetical protein
MIATGMGAVYLSEMTTNETMLPGIFVAESAAVVSAVFIIHPFV